MTQEQASRTQVSLAHRGIPFVHVAPTRARSVRASKSFYRWLPATVKVDMGTRFIEGKLQGVGVEHVPYLFIEDPWEFTAEELHEIRLIAASPPFSKHEPVIFHVGWL